MKQHGYHRYHCAPAIGRLSPGIAADDEPAATRPCRTVNNHHGLKLIGAASSWAGDVESLAAVRLLLSDALPACGLLVRKENNTHTSVKRKLPGKIWHAARSYQFGEQQGSSQEAIRRACSFRRRSRFAAEQQQRTSTISVLHTVITAFKRFCAKGAVARAMKCLRSAFTGIMPVIRTNAWFAARQTRFGRGRVASAASIVGRRQRACHQQAVASRLGGSPIISIRT